MDVAKDKAGNELRVGDAVWFDAVGGIVEIVDIEYPGKIDKDKPGIITIKMQIPYNPEPGKTVANGYTFGFFLYTRNPRQEAKVEQQIDDILSGKKKEKTLHLRK